MWVNFWAWNASCGGLYGDPIAGAGIAYIDSETMEVSDPIILDVAAKGISVDLSGAIWAIPQDSPRAHRYDPVTEVHDFYTGLVTPYTYSDMTGWALQNTSCDPPG